MPPSSLLIVPNEIYFMSLVMYFPAIVNNKEVRMNSKIKLKIFRICPSIST